MAPAARDASSDARGAADYALPFRSTAPARSLQLPHSPHFIVGLQFVELDLAEKAGGPAAPAPCGGLPAPDAGFRRHGLLGHAQPRPSSIVANSRIISSTKMSPSICRDRREEDHGKS